MTVCDLLSYLDMQASVGSWEMTNTIIHNPSLQGYDVTTQHDCLFQTRNQEWLRLQFLVEVTHTVIFRITNIITPIANMLLCESIMLIVKSIK